MNVHFNSSWCLFHTIEPGFNDTSSDTDSAKYRPYKFSGRNFSFEPQIEIPVLKSLRQWASSYLAANSVCHLTHSTPLAEVHQSQRKELDLLVRVDRVIEKDALSVLLILSDLSSSMWQVTVPKKFAITQGAVYKVRGVYLEKTTERKVLQTRATTNFLRFSSDSLIARELLKSAPAKATEEDSVF